MTDVPVGTRTIRVYDVEEHYLPDDGDHDHGYEYDKYLAPSREASDRVYPYLLHFLPDGSVRWSE